MEIITIICTLFKSKCTAATRIWQCFCINVVSASNGLQLTLSLSLSPSVGSDETTSPIQQKSGPYCQCLQPFINVCSIDSNQLVDCNQPEITNQQKLFFLYFSLSAWQCLRMLFVCHELNNPIEDCSLQSSQLTWIIETNLSLIRQFTLSCSNTRENRRDLICAAYLQ